MKKIIYRYLGAIFLGLVLANLIACSSVTQSSYVQKAGFFPNRDAMYLGGKTMPPLKVPANIPPIPNDPYFDVPALTSTDSGVVSLLPPGSLAATKVKS